MQSVYLLLTRFIVPAVLFCGLASDVWGTITTQTIYVELMVDDEEVTRPHLWQAKLRDRMIAANEILSKYCDVRFEPIKFGQWDSDDRLLELSRSLREFEHEVQPAHGNIAIGFSSQHEFKVGRNSLGGTRGPMRAHILIREHAKKIHEAEKLEVLVHELGHFLGAAHSSHPQSAMRPVLGDGRALVRGYQIGFDPQNARILQLVSKEIRERSIRRYWQLSEPTLKQLRKEYTQLAAQDRSDPAAPQFLRSVDVALRRKTRQPRLSPEDEKMKQEIDRIFEKSFSAQKKSK